MTHNDISLDRIIEGVLLAAGEPLMLDRLESLFDERERPTRLELKAALDVLGQRLESSALTLSHTASGYRLHVSQALSPWVSRLWEERPQRYSRALMETLALIAYRQPVTRADIEEVRGVSVSASIMRTLTERNWVRVIGHRDVPGRPAVYATTRSFMDDFGLTTLDELPPMHTLSMPPDTEGNQDYNASPEGDILPLDEEDAPAVPPDNASETAQHAEKASTESTLDFATLGQRLIERRHSLSDQAADNRHDDESNDTDDNDD
ncbi:SMC-Scp complex subunit ScpB [Larsenimonas rhizosphaerae]|uniref:SMC-Scp complex subunit ScpB n=1 Tax=Larsenimonas rhizosphaerae TaxID=2944682 RepID=A0AA41ZL71_9GAMM|nr:SMC-Scp complex subunit ScpB [Larsenimonas rhizosphaerae]MCX2522795.1 SMC-Scp complex subunit ScpB [Larsenimonas rhizosphaerae]